MGTLTKLQIIEGLNNGKLIKNARKNADGTFDVEAASYDMSIGTAVCKKHNKKILQKRHEQLDYDPNSNSKQKSITLGPGQMVFVITHEEIMMPEKLCGTVYSRNSLAQKGILALNAGHIDPGFHGPITIKLINLRSIDYTLRLGEPIFTLVFQTMEGDHGEDKGPNYRYISREETLKRVTEATDISLDNALYDLALLREFIKKNEFGKAVREWAFKTFWGIAATVFTFILTIIGAVVSVLKLLEVFQILPPKK